VANWALHTYRPGRLRRIRNAFRHPLHEFSAFIHSHDPWGVAYLLRALEAETMLILVRLSWTHENRPHTVDGMRDQVNRHRSASPGHRIAYVCNTKAEVDLFRAKGLEAVHCSSAALVNESIYRPFEGIEKRFDAVYDARLSPFKRHQLASDVESLALIARRTGEAGAGVYEREIRASLAHAHWYNRPFDHAYHVFTPSEVNDCLNECSVGLCLSKEEGAMSASTQYLLAGLPVVSTRSLGGRDAFYSDAWTATVDDAPSAVAAGVRELIERGIPPETIRSRTLEQIHEHRGRLIAYVQRFYDELNIHRSFEDDWKKNFRNYLLDPMADAYDFVRRVRGPGMAPLEVALDDGSPNDGNPGDGNPGDDNSSGNPGDGNSSGKT
jgi:hypothetical protein